MKKRMSGKMVKFKNEIEREKINKKFIIVV